MAIYTRRINVGDIPIGKGALISVQTMTKTKTTDIKATINQIKEAAEVGCDIIRISIPDENSLKAFEKIKKLSPIPIVADIHFNYELAIGAILAGADCIRINPGNIGGKERIIKIANASKKANIPIRVGVNVGSVKKETLDKFQGNIVDSLVASTLETVHILEKCDFSQIKISAKASSVTDTVLTYRKLSKLTDYPLHIGVTESGPPETGTIKSSIAIGSLLLDDIGDTIRVSLTASPVEEVIVGKNILKTLEFLKEGIDIISCPTCARCEIDLIKLVNEFKERTKDIKKYLKVAIMGCVVNGPGEARQADIGIAAGKGGGVLFKKGEIIKKLSEEDLLDSLMLEIEKF